MGPTSATVTLLLDAIIAVTCGLGKIVLVCSVAQLRVVASDVSSAFSRAELLVGLIVSFVAALAVPPAVTRLEVSGAISLLPLFNVEVTAEAG